MHPGMLQLGKINRKGLFGLEPAGLGHKIQAYIKWNIM